MGLPGAHGAVVTGVHGMGVSAPNAAAVAAATAGFAIDLHMANGRIFIKGTLSIIFAAGIAFMTRDFGSTVIGIGAIPISSLVTLIGQTKKISITHKKTGNPLELPLPEDVGWAIIDYLQNGRPKSACVHIFIQHQAPFHELSGSTERIVLKYFNAAGIKIPVDKPKGMHIFRHSLASSM